MGNDLYQEKLLQAFMGSHLINSRTKVSGDYIGPSDCPFCGKKGKGYAHYPFPGRLFCNLSSCIAHKDNGGQSTAEYLDVTFDIEKEYKPTPKNPNKPVLPYLQSRGLGPIASRLNASYLPSIRNSGHGGIKIQIGSDKEGKAVYFCRVINPPNGFGKSHFIGKVTGCVWTLPGHTYDKDQPTYTTEGILDAASIFVMGSQAISIVSTNQDLAQLDLGKYPNLTAAFDNDPQGIKTLKKFLKCYPAAKAIMLDPGKDYNDLLRSAQSPEQAKAIFCSSIPRYKTNAQLALATSPKDYAEIYLEFHKRAPGVFTLAGSTYYAKINPRSEDGGITIERVGQFVIKVLSFVNIGNVAQQEYIYHLEISRLGQPAVKCTASGEALSTARGLKSFLLTYCKVSYEASPTAHTALCTSIVNSNAPEVRQCTFTGYDPDTKWYFFADHAIDLQGKIHAKDDGVFKNGKINIIPASQASEKTISPALGSSMAPQQIYKLINESFGATGLFALSWIIGSWFINQIKDKIGFYPILSFFGPPACGKTALTELLQCLQMVAEEGIDLSTTSTAKGIARKTHGLSGMFAALLEFSEDNKKAMAFTNILSAYNRGGGMVQAKFSNNLDTKETPLLCALLFSQNAEPFKNQQQKQRAISLKFEEGSITTATKIAYNALNAIPAEDKAAFMIQVLKNRKAIEESWYEEYKIALADLEQIQTDRIRNNHALVLGLNRVFCRLFAIESDIFTFTEGIALRKEKTSAELEINDASVFFDLIFTSKSEQLSKFWHEVDDSKAIGRSEANTLYFNVPECLRVLLTEQLPVPRQNDLMKSLIQHPAYLKHSCQHRFPLAPLKNQQGPLTEQRKAVKFDLRKFREIENHPPRD
jgi:hypothetical protein